MNANVINQGSERETEAACIILTIPVRRFLPYEIGSRTTLHVQLIRGAEPRG